MKVECKEPSSIGLTIVEMKFVELSKIRRHSDEYFDNTINRMTVKNIVRPEGITESYVQKFRRLIKNGKYDHYHHIPPVVLETEIEGEYDSLTGEHRLVAHIGESEKTMWVAVCRFDETDSMPAAYWASTYQSNENDPEDRVDDNVRTDDGTISAVKNQIAEGWITSSEKDLKMSLKHQRIKGSKKIQNLVNRIQANLGMKGCVRLTTNIDVTDALQKNGEKLDNKIIRSMNNKGGIDRDYDYRALKEIVDRLEEDPNAELEILPYFVGMNAEEVRKARKMKTDNSRDRLLYYAQKFIQFSLDGTFDKQLKIRYMGQLDGEGLYAE